MTSDSIRDALNAQLNKELYSSYLYLSMAAHFEATNLPGFATWMKGQSREEYEHAMKFWDYIYDRGGSVTLLSIDQPETTFKSPLDAFEKALQAEKDNTEQIHKLYAMAVEQKDYPTQVFLNWFIEEQVEEEKTAGQIVDTLKLVDDSSASLLLLDRELGARRSED